VYISYIPIDIGYIPSCHIFLLYFFSLVYFPYGLHLRLSWGIFRRTMFVSRCVCFFFFYLLFCHACIRRLGYSLYLDFSLYLWCSFGAYSWKWGRSNLRFSFCTKNPRHAPLGCPVVINISVKTQLSDSLGVSGFGCRRGALNHVCANHGRQIRYFSFYFYFRDFFGHRSEEEFGDGFQKSWCARIHRERWWVTGSCQIRDLPRARAEVQIAERRSSGSEKELTAATETGRRRLGKVVASAVAATW
jgi:hypothetical protein